MIRHSQQCTACRSITLYFRLVCYSVTQTVCRSVALSSQTCRSVTHTACRSVTHILSVGLPRMHYLPLCHSHAISRSKLILSPALSRVLRVAMSRVLRVALAPASAPPHATLSQFLTRCSHPLCYSLTLYFPHTQLSPPLSLIRQAISLTCIVTHTRWGNTISVHVTP